jgi:hypothetical protein
MSSSPYEKIILEGTFSYSGVSDYLVRIVFSPVRFGSGDYEDDPEIAEDVEQDTYYIWYGSITEQGKFNAGGGGFPTLAEAKATVELAPGIGQSVKWFPESSADHAAFGDIALSSVFGPHVGLLNRWTHSVGIRCLRASKFTRHL